MLFDGNLVGNSDGGDFLDPLGLQCLFGNNFGLNVGSLKVQVFLLLQQIRDVFVIGFGFSDKFDQLYLFGSNQGQLVISMDFLQSGELLNKVLQLTLQEVEFFRAGKLSSQNFDFSVVFNCLLELGGELLRVLSDLQLLLLDKHIVVFEELFAAVDFVLELHCEGKLVDGLLDLGLFGDNYLQFDIHLFDLGEDNFAGLALLLAGIFSSSEVGFAFGTLQVESFQFEVLDGVEQVVAG